MTENMNISSERMREALEDLANFGIDPDQWTVNSLATWVQKQAREALAPQGDRDARLDLAVWRIMAATDAEILADVIAEGLNPGEVADQAHAVIERAIALSALPHPEPNAAPTEPVQTVVGEDEVSEALVEAAKVALGVLGHVPKPRPITIQVAVDGLIARHYAANGTKPARAVRC